MPNSIISYWDEYKPLIGLEIYLTSTLLILYFGPVSFRLHNEWTFLALILIYHAFFCIGYWVSVQNPEYNGKGVRKVLNSNEFYLLFILGVIGVMGAYKNLMLTDTFIPYGFLDNLFRGLTEPGLVYSERMMNAEAGVTSDSRLFNITSLLFVFCKLLFIFYFVYFWTDLNVCKRFFSVFYSLLFVSSGISSGTNSVVFIFFIFISFSLLTVLYVKNYKYIGRVLFVLGFLFLIPVASFGFIMSQRGGGFEYFSGTSPLGDISVSVSSPNLDDLSIFNFFYYSFVWLNYYLVQGYYGFSLILDMDFHWTYGFGNSQFMQRQFQMLTGIDVSEQTFQSRISPVWDETVQWHSFYGQFANDFGLIGMAFFMLFLGYFFSRVWHSIVVGKTFMVQRLSLFIF